MNPLAQRALIGAGIGGVAGAVTGGLTSPAEGRGKRMLGYGLGGAALGAGVGAASHAVFPGSPAAQGVSAIDPRRAKNLGKIQGVLNKGNFADQLKADVNEYAGLANKVNLSEQDVGRMKSLAEVYQNDMAHPEHVRSFFQFGAYRHGSPGPGLKAAAYLHGMAFAETSLDL